ncbi:hypothetical protein L6R50_03715 [Myxococcota bacterium]|nr:hypothetical protein [Myxococcota bacterium]
MRPVRGPEERRGRGSLRGRWFAAGASQRFGLALACFGLGAPTSYALQRLWAAASGEAPPGAVLGQAHVPYFWRVALAALHGLVLVLVVFGMARGRTAERGLALLPWLLAAAVPAAAAAMVLVP